jgi:phosphoenolpyruvate carboxykinase (ATP)
MKIPVFNFEGGCWLPVINPSKKTNQIFSVLLKGAILENVIFKDGTNEADFQDVSITPTQELSKCH